MAYFITTKGDKTRIYRIAADDTAKDNLIITNIDNVYDVISVSDDEYNYLKNNTKYITAYNGSNYTFVDCDISLVQEDLENYIDSVKKQLRTAIEGYSSHPDNSSWQSYYNYLDNLDFSSLTYPINSSWEKYCLDNSISFVHPLQLP